MKRPLPGIIIGTLALVVLSVGATYAYTSNYYKGLLAGVHLVRELNAPYQFISPLLTITLPKGIAESQFTPLMNNIKSAAAAQPRGALSRYAVYFKDLNNGYWTGVYENEQYDPASMLKVVAAIAAYRQENDHPGFFNKRPVYTQALADINAQFPFAPATTLRVGTSYTVPFLIQEMLLDSDNSAKDLLLSSIDDAELEDIYGDLSVPKPSNTDSSDYTISALEYSRFFRVLYNGSYLTRSDSNELLGYLARTSYTRGLVAGVASSTPVAHKYGQRVNGSAAVATSIELHDCGIIYHSTNPYFLCVMTEGPDERALTTFIAQVSAIVYKEVNLGYD